MNKNLNLLLILLSYKCFYGGLNNNSLFGLLLTPGEKTILCFKKNSGSENIQQPKPMSYNFMKNNYNKPQYEKFIQGLFPNGFNKEIIKGYNFSNIEKKLLFEEKIQEEDNNENHQYNNFRQTVEQILALQNKKNNQGARKEIQPMRKLQFDE